MAQSCDTIFFIGKNGLSDEIIEQIEHAINARELIKLGVQENCEYSAREAADLIAPKLNAEVVAVIGRKFVLWRRNTEKKKPAAPKAAAKPHPNAAKKYAGKPSGGNVRSKGSGKVIRNNPRSKKTARSVARNGGRNG